MDFLYKIEFVRFIVGIIQEIIFIQILFSWRYIYSIISLNHILIFEQKPP